MAFYFQNPMAQIYFPRSDSDILWLRGRIGFHHRLLQEKIFVGVGESRAVWKRAIICRARILRISDFSVLSSVTGENFLKLTFNARFARTLLCELVWFSFMVDGSGRFLGLVPWIQPMHTLTRHTLYFSRREITRIAPTNLGRYLTVLQVGIKCVSRT